MPANQENVFPERPIDTRRCCPNPDCPQGFQQGGKYGGSLKSVKDASKHWNRACGNDDVHTCGVAGCQMGTKDISELNRHKKTCGGPDQICDTCRLDTREMMTCGAPDPLPRSSSPAASQPRRPPAAGC